MEKKYVAVMILCFVFGGYFLFSSLYQMRVFSLDGGAGIFPEPPSFNGSLNDSERLSRIERANPFTAAIPFQFMGGIVLVFAGISIWFLTSEREFKSVKESVTNNMLLPEEKSVMEELKKSGGQLTQKKLSRDTGLSKVKIHRVLNRLEEKKLIKRHPYGSTKMVVIEKEK